MPNPEPLTREAILRAAEEVLRRFGPAKMTVLDVARALNVSHGTVYRHFPSKSALRDTVTQRWLDRISAPLEGVAAGTSDPAGRLREWVRLLAETKQDMARKDPELFATFRRITDEAGAVVEAHVDHLASQLAAIVSDGVARGAFAPTEPDRAGRAILQATALFHHPGHAEEWKDTRIAGHLEAVLDLVLDGLRPRG